MLIYVQESTGPNIESTPYCTVRPSRWCNRLSVNLTMQRHGTVRKTLIHLQIRMTKAWMNTLGWTTVSDFLFSFSRLIWLWQSADCMFWT